jgi:hypothetical protein
MNKICWRLVGILSRTLESDERDAVRGDLAESDETGGQALRGVLGLVVRRQAVLWKDWRPWLVLIILVPLAIQLNLTSRRVADRSSITIWMYFNNWTWTYLASPGARFDLLENIVRTAIGYLTLVCIGCTTGFVLALMSSRTIWVNGVLFCLLLAFLGPPQYHFRGHEAVFSLSFYNAIFPVIIQGFLVLLPSLWGMYHGFRLSMSR